MTAVKLTKTDLREQQHKAKQLAMYLPTLQLKKSLLQSEVNGVKHGLKKLKKELQSLREDAQRQAYLFSDTTLICDATQFVQVQHVEKHYENIAGVEIPHFDNVIFHEADYLLFQTPAWLEPALIFVRKVVAMQERINVESEKLSALEKELRDVSIRVNLFEKILIPRTKEWIKKIRTFLGDQELAAVAQAKVAKAKIQTR